MQSAAFIIGSLGLFLYFKKTKSTATNSLPKRNANTLYLGTRRSDLAMIQTHHVADLLKKSNPNLNIEIVRPMDTIGDKILNQHLKSLSLQIPGLFTKDLEEGLLLGHFDAVVHSLKDMPTSLPPGLILAAITTRQDPLDVAIIHQKHLTKCRTLEELPHGSVIGTSAIRREAELRRRYKHKHFIYKIIRGNVNSRLSKLDNGEYDAIILAAAGLKRLGRKFEARITEFLSPPNILYGVSQGALGLECREGDERVKNILVKACEDWESSLVCLAERALLRSLEGGCQLPLGVESRVEPVEGHSSAMRLDLRGRILDEKGEKVVEDSLSRMVWNFKEAEWIGEELGKKLLEKGGEDILKELRDGGVLEGEGRDVSIDPKKHRRNSSVELSYGSAETPHLHWKERI
eukprot:snap_masked-scaffold_10-processed-gene-6.23-mRNA-1 protein AED:0.07 eAED:0.15 QI:0/-1/0/1/-1/1/1/0/403